MFKKNFTVSLLFMALSAANAASFDCNKATNFSERTICSNAEISELDENLSQIYKTEKDRSENSDLLKAEQISWIKRVRECTDAGCIRDLYIERISQLSKYSTQKPSANEIATESTSSAVASVDPGTNNSAPQNSDPVATNLINDRAEKTIISTNAGATDTTTTSITVAAAISLIFLLISLISNQTITRRKFKRTHQVRAVRDIGAGLPFLGLALIITIFPSHWLALSILGKNFEFSSISIYFLFIIVVSLFFGRIFAVKEGGIVYDSKNSVLEVPGGGSSVDSIFTYLNPIRWFEFLRRISISSDSITGISGETRFNTSTFHDKTFNVVRSKTTETHILTLITTEGEWNIKCSNRSKKSAMRTLICEAGNLELI